MPLASPRAADSTRGHRPNRRCAPRVAIGSATAVQISGETGVHTAHLRDMSPWGLGLRSVSGPPLDVGDRVQVAFGYDRWAIRRAAEVRRQNRHAVGLALAAPLPEGLWAQLLDSVAPRLIPRRQPNTPPAMDGDSDRQVTVPPAEVCDQGAVFRRDWLGRRDERVGRITVGRWWKSTWLAHQLAVCADHPDAMSCRRDLYRFAATAPRYSDGPSAHLAVLYSPEDPAHDGFTTGFARWLDAPDLATDLPLDRLSIESQPGGPKVRVDPVRSAAGVAKAARIFSAYYPPVICESFGWTETAFMSSQRGEAPGRTLYALSHGAAKGYALIEASLHDDSGLPHQAAWLLPQPGADLTALVEATRSAAADHGLEHTTILWPRSCCGTQTSDPTGLMVWSAEALKEFDTYLAEQFRHVQA